MARSSTTYNKDTAPRVGKPKGALDKKTIFRTNAQLLAKQKGVTPLELFVGLVNDETLPIAVRAAAAESVAPYLHRKLAPEAPPPPSTPSGAQVLVYIPSNQRDRAPDEAAK